MKLFKFLFVLSLPIFTGCAVGPLVNHETGRTVGDNHHELIGGYRQAGYVVKYTYGITENFDFGIHWEQLSIGLRGKYAFINNREKGWALAGAAGIGTSAFGSHYYGDVIGSYLIERWEPYATIRYVHVQNDPMEFRDSNTGNVDFRTPRFSYEYGQMILGTRYWIDEHWLISAEISNFFAISRDVYVDNNIFAGGAFGYRF